MTTEPVHETPAVAPLRQLPRYIGPSAICEALAVSRGGLHRLMQLKQFPQPIRVGAQYRWREDQIFEFLQNGGTAGVERASR